MDHYDYRLAPTSKAELSPIYTFARTQSTIASYHRSRQPIRVSRDIDVLGIYRVIDLDAESYRQRPQGRLCPTLPGRLSLRAIVRTHE